MKKVLIIAYYFPPLGGGGVQRPLKFCKYLPEFGWQPIVLTVKNGVGPVYDKTLLDELNTYKDVKVYRTMSLELGALKNLLLKKIFNKRISKCEKQSAKSEALSNILSCESDNFSVRLSAYSSIRLLIKSSLKKTFDFIYNILFKVQKFFLIPDDKMLWAIPSFFSALRIIKKEKPDVIFATVPPYSSFLLGVLLKKWTGIKLVVDYRDPWNVPDEKRYINYILEKWCLKYTNQIVYVVPKIKDWLEKQFYINNIKSELIYNGYDEDDYKDIQISKSDKFTILSGGDLYAKENVYFFKYMEKFISENPSLKDKIEIQIFSNYHQWFEDYLNQSSISNIISNIASLPKKEYLKYVKSCNIAVIFSYGNILGIQNHGRIFDYLYFNKPILILGKKDYEVVSFSKQFENIYYADKDNENDFVKILIKLMDINIKIDYYETLNEYNRKNRTKNLSKVLNN